MKNITITIILLFVEIILFAKTQNISAQNVQYITDTVEVAAIIRQTCEFCVNPINIDVVSPRFGWIVVSPIRNDKQYSYQIIVSDNVNDIKYNKGNVWNSGIVKSSQSNNIRYAGKKLRSSVRYYWKVRIFTESNKEKPFEWSEAAFFETALLSDKEWKAEWISDGSVAPTNEVDFYKDHPAPMFRKDFTVNRNVRSAHLYISGLGYYEATINGQRVGNSVLDPGWTAYDQTILYSTYDVTKIIQRHENTIGIVLGNGFYNPLPMLIFKPLREYLTIGQPKVRAQLLIEYADGSKEDIITDTSWDVLYSPIIRNNVYIGETYDARLELVGWDKPGYNLFEHKKAVSVASPIGKMTSQMQPPIRETAVLHPVRMTECRPGVYIFDMGQNFAGVIRLKVKGKRGVKVLMRYGEDIYSDGSINCMTSVGGGWNNKKIWDVDYSIEGKPQNAWQQDVYILKGSDETEVWQPRFTYHGFRYVEITGFPGKPTLESLEGIRLSADLKKTGEFICSDDMINRIEKAVEWTFLSNVFSLQSDCPHREKLGYGGDVSCTIDAFCYLFDMSTFYAKTVRDYRDARRPKGGMTETAPFIGIADNGFGDGSGPIGWQLAFGLAQKKLYDYYGNRRIISENYEIFKKQVEYIRSHAKNNLIDGQNCLGDHESLEYGTFRNNSMAARCVPVSATAHYYQHVMMLAEFANLLSRQKDYEEYGHLAQDIKASFINKFYDVETGIVGNATQTTQCVALHYNLLPDGAESKAFDQLINCIEKANNHIHTGMFTTPMILDILSKNGRGDLAYKLVTNSDFPGWGYMMSEGATTIWETWKRPYETYSQNHPMFGSINEWFYKSILGIRPLSPGFDTICISPELTNDLAWARGSYDSMKGKIFVEWARTRERYTLNISIPFGVVAEVCIPNADDRVILESGKSLFESLGVFPIKKKGKSVFKIGSGKYFFCIDSVE